MKKIELVLWGVIATWVVMAAWPMSYWYDVGSTFIEDSVSGTPPIVLYHGGAVREFTGSYNVILRDAVTEKVVNESPSEPFTYRTGVERGEIDLKWWAPKFDFPMAEGRYFIETCWTVHRPFYGFLPNKTACTEASNIFKILPAEIGTPESRLEQQSQQLLEQQEFIEGLQLQIETLSQEVIK
jgi:hypothetical protein